MRREDSTSGKNRQYNILCLINNELKLAHLSLSFSTEPEAVLRKHWRGEISETKEYFSKENQSADPKMWVWNVGYVTRKEAAIYLKEWESAFVHEGYELCSSSVISIDSEIISTLSYREKTRLRDLSVSALLSGTQGYCVECNKVPSQRLSPSQKFGREAADEFLQFRVKTGTANRFRRLCNDLGMTQNQGLEFLMATYTENYDPLIQELQNRLEKAVEELNKKDLKINDLKKLLKKIEEGKEYPKKYQAALLQHQLLRRFLDQLPAPDTSDKRMIKRYSHRSGQYVFPERKKYMYPLQEGVIKLRVEHMDYSRGPNSCLFIYGKDDKEEKIKVRWYKHKQNQFGEWMWDSPYLWVGSLWYLAVRRDGEAMELVGSIPDILSVDFVDEEVEPVVQADLVQSWIKEEELDRMCNSDSEEKASMLNGNMTSTMNQDGCLELLINAAKMKNR